MHEIEPFYNWIDYYSAAEDERSPFYGTVYSEFEYDKQIYNFLLHPQWDQIGSLTLYLKVLFVDYDKGYSIIELIGEWNDAIYNDIMILKRELIDLMIGEGITKFILIGENILNFHSSDDSYYEEWFQDIEEGWIAGINFREHVLTEFTANHIDYYINFGEYLNHLSWRTLKPEQLYYHIEEHVQRRLN
ncbi:hypothetical protein ACFRAE_07655 [Sphingobacterium sp. HJSM2_6]|uniref:hypothetical protein n=1 Tax=Sphingobacterium sp. HJSM2_6 TaxID=3366264 RepID=UPI003BCAF72C